MRSELTFRCYLRRQWINGTWEVFWYMGSLDKYAAIAELYEASHGFPGVVGMIDGTHIAIRMPAERRVEYYNRKLLSVKTCGCISRVAGQCIVHE